MDFKFCLLSAGLLARHAHACPKVTVSRLKVTTGVDARHACPRVTVSRLIVCDDGVDAIAKWRKNAGNSVEPIRILKLKLFRHYCRF